MHLVSCDTPQGSLETAPRTALLAESNEGERWDGFWSAQTDAYYARCTRIDGGVEWFELSDDESADSSAEPDAHAVAASDARPATSARFEPRARVAVVVARSPDGRRMLVGSARRSSRS
jgi:hypothetical protein